MAVEFEALRGRRGAPARLARHDYTYTILEPLADRILARARQDPNEAFSQSLRKYKSARIMSGGARSVRWNITGPTRLVLNVEAKRATLRRAAKA